MKTAYWFGPAKWTDEQKEQIEKLDYQLVEWVPSVGLDQDSATGLTGCMWAINQANNDSEMKCQAVFGDFTIAFISALFVMSGAPHGCEVAMVWTEHRTPEGNTWHPVGVLPLIKMEESEPQCGCGHEHTEAN